jgi:hypothetical protein
LTIDQQHSEAFARGGLAKMALDQRRGEIDDAGAAGAGDAIAVLQIQLIGDRLDIAEFSDQIPSVEPTDATFARTHEPGSGQNERARAYADQGYVRRRGLTQIALARFIDLRSAGQQPANDYEIIEIAGIHEAGGRQDFDAATCADRLAARRRNGPATTNLP